MKIGISAVVRSNRPLATILMHAFGRDATTTQTERQPSITDARSFPTSSSRPVIRTKSALGFEHRSHAAPPHFLRLTEPPSIYSPTSVARVFYTSLQYPQLLLRRLTF